MYLRISITDRCNRKCIYCMPPEGVRKIPKGEILSFEEIEFFINCALKAGAKKFRITGGEPTLRSDLPKLVKMINSCGVKDLAMTTNGVLLKRFIFKLIDSGLKKINISFNTITGNTYKEICRSSPSELNSVLEGVRLAVSSRRLIVKLNTILMKNVNENELLPLISIAAALHVPIRFIELMPIGIAKNTWKDLFIPNSVVIKRLRRHFDLELLPQGTIQGAGPAVYYNIKELDLNVGFISPITDPSFCATCNRLRLTPNGKLIKCLRNADKATDIRHLLRNREEESLVSELKRLFQEKRRTMPPISKGDLISSWRPACMSEIGG